MGCVSGRVLGVDACSAGWVGIALTGSQITAYVHADIEALVQQATADGPLQVIGIDMPIGLPDASARRADLEARAAAGPRWASVFVTPVRATLAFTDYRQASELNKEITGRGISRQAFNLLEKIRQVDGWLQMAPCRIVEVHPELSFAAMAGAPLQAGKSSWAGLVTRRRLLADAGIVLADDLGPAGRRAGADDVLDAAAAAWSARRVASGQARRLPAEPEQFSDQIDCAIWT
jgi:predicted RNase H-like nuclease